MIDIDKHIKHWQSGSEEDLRVAAELLENQRVRHSLFFVHLALEKLLKALVCKVTQDLAPRIHNLVRLAELTKLDLPDNYSDLLAEVNPFSMEGRYPELLIPIPTGEEARNILASAVEVYEWLRKKL